MKKSRFTAEQIVSILNEAATKETKLAEACRKHGITEQTYYRWHRAYGGQQPNEVKRLRLLEDENRRVRKLIADQALDITRESGSLDAKSRFRERLRRVNDLLKNYAAEACTVSR
jgi:putative transposase